MTARISRKTVSSTTEFIVFPRGKRCSTLKEALESKEGGDWIREYTLVEKAIIITINKRDIKQAHGTYVNSREIKNDR